MEKVYLVCAVVGSTLIVCQFLVTLLGIGGGHDTVGDASGHDVSFDHHDVAGSHGVGHDTEPAWIFSLLTFRTLTAATAFFGLAGMAGEEASLEPIPTLAAALGAGFVALVIVGWLMRMLNKFNIDGTVRIERAQGARGTVYLPIPAEKTGAGKVLVSVNHRTMEYKAITAHEPLPTGAKIVVIAVIGPDTVEVTPVSVSEGGNHAEIA